MSRNSLAILAWSITTALLVSACADRPGAFKAIDLSKVQVKTQPDTAKKDGQGSKSADDEKAARDRAEVSENARFLRKIMEQVLINSDKEKTAQDAKGTQDKTENTLPPGQAEGTRVETSSNPSADKKDESTSDEKKEDISDVKSDFELVNRLIFTAIEKESEQVITSLIRGMDFTVILNANGTLKLTVESLVRIADQAGQTHQVALISTTDQNNMISTKHMIGEGKLVELTVPEDIQNSQNVMSPLKFYAAYGEDTSKIVIIAAFESDGSGQGGKQVGVGAVLLGFESYESRPKCCVQMQVKMKVLSSSWGSKLLSVKEAQDLLAVDTSTLDANDARARSGGAVDTSILDANDARARSGGAVDTSILDANDARARSGGTVDTSILDANDARARSGGAVDTSILDANDARARKNDKESKPNGNPLSSMTYL